MKIGLLKPESTAESLMAVTGLGVGVGVGVGLAIGFAVGFAIDFVVGVSSGEGEPGGLPEPPGVRALPGDSDTFEPIVPLPPELAGWLLSTIPGLVDRDCVPPVRLSKAPTPRTARITTAPAAPIW